MMDLWVANASPIICLAKSGLLDLLIQLPDELSIPHDVAAEIEAGPTNDPARTILQSSAVSLVEVNPAREILAWDLGKGETSVLTYALVNPGWTALIDDRAARKCAISFSIPVKGTLAILLIAKKRGLIDSAEDAIDRLITSGLRIGDELVRDFLKQAKK